MWWNRKSRLDRRIVTPDDLRALSQSLPAGLVDVDLTPDAEILELALKEDAEKYWYTLSVDGDLRFFFDIGSFRLGDEDAPCEYFFDDE